MTFPTFAKLGHELFRPYETDGVPGSGAHLPIKTDIQAYLLSIETALDALISRTPLINGYFTASVAGNVLTVAVKTKAGADPSASSPVYADFRSVTQTDGSPSVVAITAALSMTVSAGSTVGFANSVAGRLWVVLFNNGGTPALGIYNAYGGNTAGALGQLFPLYPSLVATTTAEGGAGAADSAGTFYTPAALTSKAFIVLGHLTWSTVLATAGNWSAAPDSIHQQRFGDLLAGEMVQRAPSWDAAEAHATTTTPFDNTIPQSSEGNQFMTAAITPKSPANILEIDHAGNYAASVAAHITVALFQDSTAGALNAHATKVNTANDVVQIGLRHVMLAGTTSATTMKIRAGMSTAGTTGFNGSNSTGLFNGVDYSFLEVVERMG